MKARVGAGNGCTVLGRVSRRWLLMEAAEGSQGGGINARMDMRGGVAELGWVEGTRAQVFDILFFTDAQAAHRTLSIRF